MSGYGEGRAVSRRMPRRWKRSPAGAEAVTTLGWVPTTGSDEPISRARNELDGGAAVAEGGAGVEALVGAGTAVPSPMIRCMNSEDGDPAGPAAAGAWEPQGKNLGGGGRCIFTWSGQQVAQKRRLDVSFSGMVHTRHSQAKVERVVRTLSKISDCLRPRDNSWTPRLMPNKLRGRPMTRKQLRQTGCVATGCQSVPSVSSLQVPMSLTRAKEIELGLVPIR